MPNKFTIDPRAKPHKHRVAMYIAGIEKIGDSGFNPYNSDTKGLTPMNALVETTNGCNSLLLLNF